MKSFVENVKDRLISAGLSDVQQVGSSQELSAFGDATATFLFGSLLLRFVQERGQEFVDIAAAVEPTVFHQTDDVDIAMGWKSIEEVLLKREPEDISLVLSRIYKNRVALNEAFSGERESFTRARVEKIARDRGKMFTDRLNENGSGK